MIIIYKRPGRLANSIWLYAHFIAFAIEHDISVCFPALTDYGDYFKFSKSNLFYSFPQQKTIISSNYLRSLILKFIPYLIRFSIKFNLNFTGYIFLKHDNEFDLEDINNMKMLSKNLVFIEGWLFRANSLVVKHRDKIIDFLKPQEMHKNNVNILIKKCKAECTVLIGVHIRREDYKTAFEGKYYYEMSDYKRKMQETKEIFKGKEVAFLICSNENVNVNEFSELKIFLANDHIVEDLYSLAECNYIIGPPSTYSMWASYYGNVPLLQLKEISLPITLDEFQIIKD